MSDDFENDDLDDDGGDASGLDLAHRVEDAYAGDPRFETVELMAPGPLEGESVRVRLIVNDESHFFLAVLEDDGFVRVGLATESETLSLAIEKAILDSGFSPTEFVEEAIGTGDELENEVQHFHDDAYYFASDLPCNGPEHLASRTLRDEAFLYLDGYLDSLFDLLTGADE